MTAVTLNMRSASGLRSIPTPTASKEGNNRLFRWIGFMSQASSPRWTREATERSIGADLSTTLSRSTYAVFEQARYLGTKSASEIVAALSELLSPDCWDETDEMLKIGSVRTQIRGIIALQKGP